MKTLLIIGWLACSVAAYLILRSDIRSNGCHWTIGDRAIGFILSTMGPVAMIPAIIFLIARLAESEYWDGPAKW